MYITVAETTLVMTVHIFTCKCLNQLVGFLKKTRTPFSSCGPCADNAAGACRMRDEIAQQPRHAA